MSVVVDQAVTGGELALGRELDGRFTVLEKLGEGGMGALYRAHQHSVDREVAIKVIRKDLVANPEAIKLFLREAKLTSKLNHPNAVGVLDFGQTEDGVFYLVMELVKGRGLDQVLREEGILSPARVVRIGMQVCEALEKAHEMQIVHRDLKPANIMLLTSRRDFVKVLDFGLAKTLEAAQAHVEVAMGTPSPIAGFDPHVTTLLGTPAFLPPERSLGAPADGRSDLYSLGCVLYLLASGTLPFKADSPRDVVVAHSTNRPTPLANIPPSIARVIDKMIARDPNDRFQSAADARDALEESAALDNVVYQSSPSIEQARMSMRMSQPSIEVPDLPSNSKRLAIWIVAGAAAIVLLVIVLFAATRSSDVPVEASPLTKLPPSLPSPEPPRRAETQLPAPAVAEPVPVQETLPANDSKSIKKRPLPRKVLPVAPPVTTGKPKLPF